MTHWSEFLDPTGPDGAYLPWKKVESRVGISRTTAWRLQKCGEFPKPYIVSPGRVAYRESEVEAWKASRRHRVASRLAQTCEVLPSRSPASAASAPAAAKPVASKTRPSAPALPPPAPSLRRSLRARPARPVDTNQIAFEF